MQLNRIGPKIFWMLALLVIPLWLISFPETTLRHNIKPVPVYLSQVTALIGFACFALSFVLAARIKKLEDYFGGLDRIYHTHHTMAVTAFILLILHALLLAVRWIPEDSGRLFWYLFPIHRRFEINLGSYALWGLIFLMLTTFIKKLPYDIWKITHKFTGVFFLIGVFHILFMNLSYSSNPALMSYLIVLSVTGLGFWIYKTALFDFIKPKTPYTVQKLSKPNDQILEIELSPDSTPVTFHSGQFFFFSFHTPGISKESHPYTITEIQDNRNIKIMVKALGDYTSRLHQVLNPGTTAYLEGPYGRFNYRNGKPNQVWIAGGVGVAPFLCWVNELLASPDNNLKVDFYYCVNTGSEAAYIERFEKLSSTMAGFKHYLIRADREGFINIDNIPEIENREIFICGPRALRAYILKKLKTRKLPKDRIHFEDFDFV